MLLEINKPYGVNLGENLVLTGTYVKGKKKIADFDNYDLRFLFEGEATKKKYVLVLEKHPVGGERLDFMSADGFKFQSSGVIKNRYYNYYPIESDGSHFEEILKIWRESDPLVRVSKSWHKRVSDSLSYTWAYRFNGKKY
jgi:hypothetical protein